MGGVRQPLCHSLSLCLRAPFCKGLRADGHTLAVILYELLTGKLPFDARTPMEFIGLHVQAQPLSLAERAPDREYPVGLQDVLDRALAKKPEERYQSAAEFASALHSIVNDRNVEQAMSAIPDAAAALAETVPAIQAMQRQHTPRPLPAADAQPSHQKAPTPQPTVAVVAQHASDPRTKQVTNPTPASASPPDAPVSPPRAPSSNTAGLIAIGVVIGLVVAGGALAVIRFL